MQELVQLLPRSIMTLSMLMVLSLCQVFFPHKHVQETATTRKSPAQTILKGIN